MSLRAHRAVRGPGPATDPNLFCYGCAHSAASADFPGHPSGERPCGFCVRNPEHEEQIAELEEKRARYVAEHPDANPRSLVSWYDGSPPIKVPMDCYQSVDMLMQVRAWATADAKP